MRRHINLELFVFLILLYVSAGCVDSREVIISGYTMGTFYNVKIVGGKIRNTNKLKTAVENRLKEINMSMSTYIAESEISKFNADISDAEKFWVSDDFINVMMVSKKLYKLTDGAWDGTIKSLSDLWGFGSTEKKVKIPEKKAIDRILAKTGFDKIIVKENNYLKKQKADVKLDLSSVAKGYAVDQIAELIIEKGFENFLVEIGGEVYASGFRGDGKEWKIGINMPEKNASFNKVYQSIKLHNTAVATSGDYRIFFEVDGKRYSHVLDPKTGCPVSNQVVSVSILSNRCAFADGLATAVMVLGHKKGLQLINRLENVEGLIIARQKDGAFTDYYSKGFKAKYKPVFLDD